MSSLQGVPTVSSLINRVPEPLWQKVAQENGGHITLRVLINLVPESERNFFERHIVSSYKLWDCIVPRPLRHEERQAAETIRLQSIYDQTQQKKVDKRKMSADAEPFIPKKLGKRKISADAEPYTSSHSKEKD